MIESSNDYELNVLKMMVNKYLEEVTSVTEESLRELEVNCDQVVWDLATKIYSQSGHKIDLSIVRDVVNSRTKVIKYQLTTEVEQKAQEAAEEARRIAVQEAQLRDQIGSVLAELGGNIAKAQVFIKVRKIISEQLSVDENKVVLSSHLSNDLGACDSYECIELVMALEEEFEIDISDSETKDELGVYYFSRDYTASDSSVSGSRSSGISSFSFRSISSSSFSSSNAGNNCIVRSFVDLIHKKVHG